MTDALVDAVFEEMRAGLRREEDRALNRARALQREAEDHVAGLTEAARDLGRTRAEAAGEDVDRQARAEVRALFEGAFERLFERFCRRVETALEALGSDERYAEALAAWARSAASVMDGPADVHAATRDREAVYEALLAAGAKDFRVKGDRRIAAGFVVRDADGRTLLDRRPRAIVEERREGLERLLREIAPPPPEAPGSEG